MKNLLAIYMLYANALVLDYSDFGPQAMAYELIGFQWWQWEKPCCSEPDSIYNIKVVVYKDKDIALNEVKALFPVNPEQQQDYRYLEYSKAVSYLTEHIQDDEMPSLLKETKRKIVESLVQDKSWTPELP
ncbi:hypothetical protein PN36_23915 [Candidatus Thiomargarita nelsonii]|uniref:Uncharacterized protein n=1 Tax=Candidatus Thiomargarita nelsonii TaxID=1003181 RepID=A0A0A6PR11_9GAMM|nr:hypothetical protein PN36_23915 [Candidatus Thiomargarita nelsonii]